MARKTKKDQVLDLEKTTEKVVVELDLMKGESEKDKRGKKGKKEDKEVRLKEAVAELVVPALKYYILVLPIYGNSLITGRMSEKALDDYEDQYITKKDETILADKPKRDIEAEWEGATHNIDSKNNIYGFPAMAFKKTIVRAFGDNSNLPMTTARLLFKVMPEFPYEGTYDINLIKIDYEDIVRRRDLVVRRSGKGKSPSLAYRKQFINWSAILQVEFDESIIRADQLLPFIVKAGKIGVGSWNIMKDGLHGTFEISPEGIEIVKVDNIEKVKVRLKQQEERLRNYK